MVAATLLPFLRQSPLLKAASPHSLVSSGQLLQTMALYLGSVSHSMIKQWHQMPGCSSYPCSVVASVLGSLPCQLKHLSRTGPPRKRCPTVVTNSLVSHIADLSSSQVSSTMGGVVSTLGNVARAVLNNPPLMVSLAVPLVLGSIVGTSTLPAILSW